MRWVRDSLNHLARGVDAVLVMLFVVMVVVITWQVFARYVLDSPTRWSEELARFLVAWVTMLGTAVALRNDDHVVVTVVVERLPRTLRRVAEILRDAVILVTAGTLAWYGYALAMQAVIQRAPGLGISMSWAYASIPVGAVLIPLFLLAARIKGRSPEDDTR